MHTQKYVDINNKEIKNFSDVIINPVYYGIKRNYSQYISYYENKDEKYNQIFAGFLQKNLFFENKSNNKQKDSIIQIIKEKNNIINKEIEITFAKNIFFWRLSSD